MLVDEPLRLGRRRPPLRTLAAALLLAVPLASPAGPQSGSGPPLRWVSDDTSPPPKRVTPPPAAVPRSPS